MNVKEPTPGILIAKQNNLPMLFISLGLIIGGIIAIIKISLPAFNLSEFETYIGFALLIIGASIFLFAWKRRKIIFDKNQNTFLITLKGITNNYEKKGILSDISEIAYSEFVSVNFQHERGARREVTKIVELKLKNGEVYDVFKNRGSQNFLLPNRTKINAQKIADFIGLPLQTFTTKDAFKNIGQAISNQFNQTKQPTQNQPQNQPQNQQNEQTQQRPNQNPQFNQNK